MAEAEADAGVNDGQAAAAMLGRDVLAAIRLIERIGVSRFGHDAILLGNAFRGTPPIVFARVRKRLKRRGLRENSRREGVKIRGKECVSARK
jgi:hypothetical protein